MRITTGSQDFTVYVSGPWFWSEWSCGEMVSSSVIFLLFEGESSFAFIFLYCHAVKLTCEGYRVLWILISILDLCSQHLRQHIEQVHTPRSCPMLSLCIHPSLPNSSCVLHPYSFVLLRLLYKWNPTVWPFETGFSRYPWGVEAVACVSSSFLCVGK